MCMIWFGVSGQLAVLEVSIIVCLGCRQLVWALDQLGSGVEVLGVDLFLVEGQLQGQWFRGYIRLGQRWRVSLVQGQKFWGRGLAQFRGRGSGGRCFLVGQGQKVSLIHRSVFQLSGRGSDQFSRSQSGSGVEVSGDRSALVISLVQGWGCFQFVFRGGGAASPRCSLRLDRFSRNRIKFSL